MSTDTLERPKLRPYRIIKQAGKPVGPHVDFARDDKGEIIRGKPYKAEGGIQMPGDPVERQYYPGDIVWSEVDLTQEVDGPDQVYDPNTDKMVNVNKSGLCRKKFEHADLDREPAKAEMTVEEAKRFLEFQGAKVEMPSPTTTVGSISDAAKAGADNVNQQNVQGRQVRRDLLEAKNFKDLVDMAKAESIDVRSAKTKEDLIKVILAALNGT